MPTDSTKATSSGKLVDSTKQKLKEDVSDIGHCETEETYNSGHSYK